MLNPEGETDGSRPKRFTRPWRVGTIAYFAVAVIGLFAYSKGDWAWDMPLLFPLAVIAPVFVSFDLLAIYADEFRLGHGGGGTFYFYRARNPVKYWICVATTLSAGVFVFLVGVLGE